MMTGRAVACTAGLVVAATLGVAAAAASVAVPRGATATTSGSASFSDPAGDANGAPDVTAITISDDPASGVVQFTLTAVGTTAIDPAKEPELNIFIDTDRNTGTGSPSGREFPGSPAGADYRLCFEWTSTGSVGDAEYWSGTSWLEAAPAPTMSVGDDTFTWRLRKSDLGAASGGFDFYVATEIFVGHQTVGLDRAPESGVWSYELQASPATTTQATTTESAVKPVIGSPTTTPRRPAAGKRFTVAFRVTRS
jgi:hypothetical protein